MTYEQIISGYQLLGDSQLRRFSEKILKTSRQESNGRLCVSGQNIDGLLRRVRANKDKISEKLIVMIGTNDILQKTEVKKMRYKMDRLLLQLIQYGATHIILMTLPPIPKLTYDSYHWKTLKEFNNSIRQRHNGEDIFVIDAYTKFIKKAPEKIELKPFGLSQNVNRINSNFDGITREYSRKPSSSEDKTSSLALENDLDESETWQQKYIVYNSSSDYTCDTDRPCDFEADPINLHYFEHYVEKNKKIDLIHLNYYGLEQIKELIVKKNYIKP